MAPQNLNQVFVVNNPDMISTSTFANNAAANVSQFSVWDVDLSTNFVTALRTSGAWNKKRIQIVQTMPSGQPISTPIIDTDLIKRINYREWTSVVPTRATQTVDFGATATKNVMIRIALRTAPTAYEYFVDPADGTLDLSGGGFVFPILGNFSAGRMIFNIELTGASETAMTTALTAAIAANKTLNAIFSAADNGASGCAITARHYGVEFDVTSAYSDGTGALGTVVGSRTDASSNYIQALSDEKKQRARYGNFNRMYFPMTFPTFAQSGYKYDVLEIQYEHDWPSSTGIARAGQLNTVKIYFGASSTALAYAAAATGTEVATVFGFTGLTDSEQIF
jgi:flavin-binding protein dodecin